MARVIWTPSALRDVQRLHHFLTVRNAAAASRAVRTSRESVQTLGPHPEIGQPLEELPPEFREWVIPFGRSTYVMLYHYDGVLVAILAVRHGREAGYIENP